MVQGVFFREGVRAEAERLGLTGWVRNKEDGSVKVAAEGEEEELQKLIAWCRKGTTGANVTDVLAEWQEARGEFKDFRIIQNFQSMPQ